MRKTQTLANSTNESNVKNIKEVNSLIYAKPLFIKADFLFCQSLKKRQEIVKFPNPHLVNCIFI